MGTQRGPVRLAEVRATRYVAPLREGGSMPGLVEAEDDGLYVCKFRGAGQGPRALAAEVVAGEVGRALGLPVPDLVVLDVAPELGAAEPDPEIQDLLRASTGRNAGMDFLPGALAFDPSGGEPVDAAWAADMVWFDAFVTNVDRTPRNPNMLVWHGRTWLIDHGAALYLHHSPGDLVAHAARAFAPIAQHVLLPRASSLRDADARMASRLDDEVLRAIAAAVPDDWLSDGPMTPDERRDQYVRYLCGRLAGPRPWVEAAEAARRGG